MSKDKESRKQQYRAFLIKTEGFIIDIKDRGEYAEYEDEFCIGSFEISGGLDCPRNIYNLKISSKDKNHSISNEDMARVNENINKRIT